MGDDRDREYRPAWHYSRACQQWCLLAINAQGVALVTPWRCGSWVCQRGCGVQRGKRWYSRALAGLEALGAVRVKFLTLTFDRAALGHPRAAWARLGPSWNRWRTSSRRAWGPYEYLRVIELHKSGWPHIHAVIGVDAYMPHAHVSALAVRAGFGRVVDIRQAWRKRARAGGVRGPVDAPGSEAETRRAVARYISKYLLKQQYYLPGGVRRVNCSRGWGAGVWFAPVPATSELTWELVERTADAVADEMLAKHYDVRRLDLGMTVEGDD